MSDDIKLQDKNATWATDLLSELEALQIGSADEGYGQLLQEAKIVSLQTIKDVILATENPLDTKNRLLEFWKTNSLNTGLN
ncbi:MAG: hypothetical protein KGS72_12205 [Cyanobacteria bacterium REEB67]|nr:hypothetical protein [Cyanobacteria bacterium REEB67]